MIEIEGYDAIIERDRTKVAGKAGPLVTHAEAGALGGRGNKASVHNTGFTRGSTNASYLAARLKRDHPEIAAVDASPGCGHDARTAEELSQAPNTADEPAPVLAPYTGP